MLVRDNSLLYARVTIRQFQISCDRRSYIRADSSLAAVEASPTRFDDGHGIAMSMVFCDRGCECS